jgi:ABC-type cobalt transport system substrate-binding protein
MSDDTILLIVWLALVGASLISITIGLYQGRRRVKRR